MTDLLLAILTVTMSGVAAAVVTYVLNDQRDRLFFLRAKAEELVTCIETYARGLGGHFVLHYPVLKREMTYDQLHDLVIAKGKEEMGSASNTMTMLIAIYFPSVEPAWLRVDGARAEVNRIIALDMQAYRAGMGTDAAARFHEALGDLNDAMDALKASAIKAGRRLCRSERIATQVA